MIPSHGGAHQRISATHGRSASSAPTTPPQVTVWATPNPGYRFDAWAVDGVELPNTLPPSSP